MRPQFGLRAGIAYADAYTCLLTKGFCLREVLCASPLLKNEQLGFERGSNKMTRRQKLARASPNLSAVCFAKCMYMYIIYIYVCIYIYMCVCIIVYIYTYVWVRNVRTECMYVHILSFTHALLCLEQPNHSWLRIINLKESERPLCSRSTVD